MARNDSVNVNAATWTQLTNANATAIRVQNLSASYPVMLQATSGETAPASDAGALELGPSLTVSADMTIAQLWPGVAGANRIWAKSKNVASIGLSVSHADA